MDTLERRRLASLLVGLPLLSNAASLIIYGPLYAPGRSPTVADFHRAATYTGIAVLLIEVVAAFLLAIFLRAENASFKTIVNFRPHRAKSYLIVGSVALIPTLLTGWLYTLGQAQARVEIDRSQLSQGETILWFVLTPVVAGLLEETIWRGYAIPRIRGTSRSLLLTSLSFALFHGVFNPLAVAATFLQGLIWGWTYRRAESTVPSMALHFLSRYLTLAF